MEGRCLLLTTGATLAGLHGLILGAFFLLAYSGGLATLFALRVEWEKPTGISMLIRQLKIGTVLMAVTIWLTVITGTYIVYPLYRAQYQPALSITIWNTFAMAWKMHLAWIAPMLATAVAYVVIRYRTQLAREARIRQTLEVLFTAAFAAAGLAGLLGAFVTKVLPVQ
jgi:glycerol uptake facilitator-like aquaporin